MVFEDVAHTEEDLVCTAPSRRSTQEFTQTLEKLAQAANHTSAAESSARSAHGNRLAREAEEVFGAGSLVERQSRRKRQVVHMYRLDMDDEATSPVSPTVEEANVGNAASLPISLEDFEASWERGERAQSSAHEAFNFFSFDPVWGRNTTFVAEVLLGFGDLCTFMDVGRPCSALPSHQWGFLIAQNKRQAQRGCVRRLEVACLRIEESRRKSAQVPEILHMRAVSRHCPEDCEVFLQHLAIGVGLARPDVVKALVVVSKHLGPRSYMQDEEVQLTLSAHLQKHWSCFQWCLQRTQGGADAPSIARRLLPDLVSHCSNADPELRAAAQYLLADLGQGGGRYIQEMLAELGPILLKQLLNVESAWEEKQSAMTHSRSCNRFMSGALRRRWIDVMVDVVLNEVNPTKTEVAHVSYAIRHLEILITTVQAPAEVFPEAIGKLHWLLDAENAPPPVVRHAIDFLKYAQSQFRDSCQGELDDLRSRIHQLQLGDSLCIPPCMTLGILTASRQRRWNLVCRGPMMPREATRRWASGRYVATNPVTRGAEVLEAERRAREVRALEVRRCDLEAEEENDSFVHQSLASTESQRIRFQPTLRRRH
eukprot:s6597_g2.t9